MVNYVEYIQMKQNLGLHQPMNLMFHLFYQFVVTLVTQ